MGKDSIYETEREIRTFANLFHSSNVLLKISERYKYGNYHSTMSSLILTSFAFEAFLNHAGSELIKFWDEIERIKVMEKLSVICKEIDYEADFSKRPFQTLKLLFKFRNSIAHGKSVILKETKEINAGDDLTKHTPKAEWEEYCTFDNAKRAREDIQAIIEELHNKAGLSGYPFKLGGGSGVLLPKTPNK